MRDPGCPKCGGTTFEDGFVLEKKHHNAMNEATRWIAGKVEKSFWFGVKTHGRERATIHAKRCARCGYLELYAPPES